MALLFSALSLSCVSLRPGNRPESCRNRAFHSERPSLIPYTPKTSFGPMRCGVVAWTPWPNRPWRVPASHTTRMNSKVHARFKTTYHVASWPAYNEALVRRGDVTVWLAPEAVAAWTPRRIGTRGG
jgi:hypothetical protein